MIGAINYAYIYETLLPKVHWSIDMPKWVIVLEILFHLPHEQKIYMLSKVCFYHISETWESLFSTSVKLRYWIEGGLSSPQDSKCGIYEKANLYLVNPGQPAGPFKHLEDGKLFNCTYKQPEGMQNLIKLQFCLAIDS